MHKDLAKHIIKDAPELTPVSSRLADFFECQQLFDVIREHHIHNSNRHALGAAQGAFDMRNVVRLRELHNGVLASQLDELQRARNDGRGISCVRQIVQDLQRNDVRGAKMITFNEWDKIANYRDVAQWLIKNKFADEDSYIFPGDN